MHDKLVSERRFTTLEPLGICSGVELVNEFQTSRPTFVKIGVNIDLLEKNMVMKGSLADEVSLYRDSRSGTHNMHACSRACGKET